MDWIKKHMLLVLILALVIVVGVWYGMSGSAPAPVQSELSTETIGDTGSPSEDQQDRDLVETLLTLRAITLSGTIFSDPAFKALQDFGTTIIPEPVGRDNPFAPLHPQSAQPQQNTQVQLQRAPQQTPSLKTSGR